MRGAQNSDLKRGYYLESEDWKSLTIKVLLWAYTTNFQVCVFLIDSVPILPRDYPKLHQFYWGGLLNISLGFGDLIFLRAGHLSLKIRSGPVNYTCEVGPLQLLFTVPVWINLRAPNW